MTVAEAEKYKHLFILIEDKNCGEPTLQEKAYQAYGFLQGHERGVREEKEKIKQLVEALKSFSEWVGETPGYLKEALEAYQSQKQVLRESKGGEGE